MSNTNTSNNALRFPYFNRELSWLTFNRRVLQQAQSLDYPLLERMKFLAFVSSNLDEFFEALVTLYYLRLFLMIVIALKIKKPSFSLSFPQNIKNIIKYSLFLILAASASTIIIDIDKSYSIHEIMAPMKI